MEFVYIIVSNMGDSNMLESKRKQRISYRDELLYLFVLYHVMCFSPGFVTDEPTLHHIGYSLCAMYVLHLLLDLIGVLRTIILSMYKKLKSKYRISQAKKKLAKFRAETVSNRKKNTHKMMKNREQDIVK